MSGSRFLSVSLALALSLSNGTSLALAADETSSAPSPYGNRAEEVNLDEDAYYAPEAVYVTNFAVVNVDSALRGSFAIQNTEAEVVSGLGYRLEVFGTGETEALAYFVAVGEKRFTLAPNETASHIFNVPLPVLPVGTYKARAQIVTAQGRPLGWNDQEIVVKEQTGAFAYLFPGTIGIAEYGDELLQPLSGPNVSPATEFTLHATAFNDSFTTMTVTPMLDVYDFDVSRSLASTMKFDSITLKPGESKELNIPLTSEDVAGVYMAQLRLMNGEDEVVSSIAQYRWVVRGADASILTARISNMGTKAGQAAYITVDTAGAADAETPVTVTLQLELRDAQGVLGAIEVPSIALTDAIEMAKARIPLDRDLVGTPSLVARIVGDQGQILDSYTFGATTATQIETITSQNAFMSWMQWHGVARVSVITLLSLLALYAIAQVAIRMRRSGMVLSRALTASFLMFALFANATTGFAAGNGNGIEVLTPKNGSSVYGPIGGKPVIALFINKPIHNEQNNLCNKQITLEYRVEFAVCVNQPSYARVLGRFATNGGKHSTYNPSGVTWQTVHNQTYTLQSCNTHFCIAKSSTFTGTIDLSALEAGKNDTTLQLVAKFGWNKMPDSSFSTSDKYIQKQWAHAVNLWLMCTPPDLSITKSFTTQNPVVVRGGVVSYNVTVTNSGQSAANNVVITDPIPAPIPNPGGGSYTFNSAGSDQTCGQQGNNVVCNIGTLAAGASRTVAIAFNVPAATPDSCQPAQLTNTATVSSSTTETNTTNNTSQTVTTTVNCPVPEKGCIQIIKETYNTLNNPLTPVPQFTFKLDGGQTTVNDANGNARFDNVTPGVHTITEIVPAGWDNYNITPANGQVTVIPGAVCVAVAFKNRQTITNTTDLIIQKSTTQSSVPRGGVLTYSIKVTNTGNQAANGVVVTDNIPQGITGLTFLPGSSDASCSLTNNNQTVSCQLNTINGNSDKTINLAFSVPTMDGVCQGGQVSNVAQVTTTTTETNANNNATSNNTSNTVTTPVTCPAPQVGCINIVKEAFDTNNNKLPITPQFTFFLDGAAMTQNDAAGNTQFLNVTPGSHQVTEEQVNGWTMTSVSPVNGSITVPASNSCVTVTFRNKQNSTIPDLTINKVANQNSVVRGSTASFNVTVTNSGPGVATNVVITDPIPTGMTFFANGSDNSCNQSGNNVVCNLQSISSGGNRTVTIAFQFQATAQACQESTITNTATVSSSPVDSNTANNSSTATMGVTCPTANVGCIQVLKETYDSNNNPITPIPQMFTFNLDGNVATATTNAQGIARFDNVPANQSHTVTEVTQNGWILFNTTPTNSQVYVQASQVCAGMTFKNRQVAAQTTNLTIDKIAQSSVQRGSNTTFGITVTNSGPLSAQNVVITDAIPSGTTYIDSASDSRCNQSGQNVVCQLGTMSGNSNISLNIVFNVTSSDGTCSTGSLPNTATVSSDTTETNSNDNSDTATTSITCPTPDTTNLTIQKSGPSTIQRGSNLTYTLSVTNSGPLSAQNVVITDAIPTNTTYIDGSSDSRCNQSGSNVLCTLGTMGNQTITLQLVFNVTQSNGTCTTGSISNIASVSSGTTETNSNDNTSTTVMTAVTCPTVDTTNLTIAKTAMQSNVLRGQNGTFNVVVTNSGPLSAQNVVVTDTVPSGSTYVDSLSDTRCDLNQAGTHVVCTLGTMSSGQSITLPLVFTANQQSGTCSTGTLSNSATVTTATTENTNDNTATASMNITCPEAQMGCIDVIKETYNQNGSTLTPVTQFTFSLDNGQQTVVNNSLGNARFNNVTPGSHTVTEVIPTGWTNYLVTPTGGTVNVTSGSSCVTVTFKNRQNSQVVTTEGFTITKTDHKTEVEPGDTLEYEIRVRNTGNTRVTDVTVTDELPDDVEFVDATPNADDEDDDEVSWENETFEAGEEKIYRIEIEVSEDADDGDIIRNRATVRGITATDTTEVEEEDDDDDDNDEDVELELSKTASTSEVFPGGIIDYAVTIENTGDETIEDLEIVDNLPADVVIIDDGDADERSGRRLEWQLDELEEGDSQTFRYRVSVPTYMVPGQTIRNDVTVKADDIDERASVTVIVLGIAPKTGGPTSISHNAHLRPLAAATQNSGSTSLPFLAVIALAGLGTTAGMGVGRRFLFGI